MDGKLNESVKKVLDEYLEVNHHRKTPERYAILEAVYSLPGHFTLEELGAHLEKNNFRVSRATLYNAMRLFLELRLIVRHRLQDGTKYEASYASANHSHQICTVCGKVSEVKSTEIVRVIDNTKLKRFRKDGFALYIYGICSSCQAKLTRRKSRQEKTKKQEKTKIKKQNKRNG